VIYAERRRVLEGEDLREQIVHMMTDVITAYVNGATENGYAEDWDLDQLWSALKALYPVGIKYESIVDDTDDLTREALLAAVLEDAGAAYSRREAELDQMAGPGAMRELERRVVLSVLDRKWREHLYEMDYLKEGIGLRAMAQRDPLVEYKREGFEMFSALLEALKEESVGFLFNVQVQVAEPEVVQAPLAPAPAGSALSQLDVQASDGGLPTALGSSALRNGGWAQPESRPLTYTGPAEDGGTEVRSRGNRGRDASNRAGEPARNAPCPCGSGKKYKRCHGAPTTAHP
jgi:preprotein translocase subunit SecA